MSSNDAIINPRPPKGAQPLSAFAVMVACRPDLDAVCVSTGLEKTRFHSVMTSRLYTDQERKFSLAGPMIGAPYAVMLLEDLICRGAREILFFGWCGAIDADLKVGDIIVPSGAFIDEGTSRHYGADNGCPTKPGEHLTSRIKAHLDQAKLPYYSGHIWTTDAIYRETPNQVRHYQQKEALAVEMELSALFTVGKFRGIDVGAVLVVSDLLANLTWKPGFKYKRFKSQRHAVSEVIGKLCRNE